MRSSILRKFNPYLHARSFRPFSSLAESFENETHVKVSPYLDSPNSAEGRAQCERVANALHRYGILIFEDPRVKENDNDEYIDMMEKYFERAGSQLYAGEKVPEIFPELSFQVGATPERTERARDHQQHFAPLQGLDRPTSPFPPVLDEKWRYFWSMGKQDISTQPNVSPVDFPQWEEKMNKWGTMMLEACFTAAEMAAVGLGVQKDIFTSRLMQGWHKLAPTGSDLAKNDVGAIFAGAHYDLNFLTIHGKSRFPGLYIWLRDGSKVPVRVPTGCLLLQSGIQFERLTGGHIIGGFHEVVYSEKTKEAVEQVKRDRAAGKQRSLWRVSSTLFSTIRGDVEMAPMEEFSDKFVDGAREKYRRMLTSEQIEEELKAINLHSSMH